jgi:hypothetical protein
MRPLPDLPQLRIVPSDSLQPHEFVDEDRVEPLLRALKRERVLRNPPIVLPVTGHTAQFVVLDGANRTTAFRQMGLPTALVQVVHPGESEVRVETWNHVVLGLTSEQLMQLVKGVEGVSVSAADIEQASFDLHTGEALCYVSLPDGGVWEVTASPSRFQERVSQLGALAGCYSLSGRIERASVVDCEGLSRVYADLAGLVVFPRFEVEQVVAVAADGLLFPPGLTRFVVSPRALRLNYPIDRLAAETSIEDKQKELDDWVRQAVARRSVRYYAEATFLFDE